MFWKLHGWIDNVWEKYRRRQGPDADRPEVQGRPGRPVPRDGHRVAQIIRDKLKPGRCPDPLPVESGFFHEQVRPILARARRTCAAVATTPTGPRRCWRSAGRSARRTSSRAWSTCRRVGGGQFKRVVPGKPEQSWLYLKITGMTSTLHADLTGQCLTGLMPPATNGDRQRGGPRHRPAVDHGRRRKDLRSHSVASWGAPTRPNQTCARDPRAPSRQHDPLDARSLSVHRPGRAGGRYRLRDARDDRDAV